MKFYLPIYFLILCSQFVHAQLINSTNFESQAVGTAYTRSIWQLDGFTTDTWDNGLVDRTIVDNSTSISGTKSLRITYPVGQFGPGPNGAQVPLLFTPRDEVYMSYSLRFSENFTWGTTSYGGKLPGLAGGDNCSGGSSCDGTNGFSCRFMWRTGGQAVLYLYHMDKPDVYGEDHALVYPWGDNVVFEKGKWYHMAERVKINTNGTTYDGEVQVWVNGYEVLHLTGLRFTSNGDKIDNLYISTFHGGADATWAPTATCYTFIDDITISTLYNDVKYKSCVGPNIGANKTLCGVPSVTLDANVSTTNATFQWINNLGQTVGTSRTYSATAAGQYVVIYDSLGCIRKDTVIVSSIVIPNLGADRKICATSFEVLDSQIAGTGLTYVWKKDGVIISGANSQTISVNKAGTYSITVSVSGCADATDNVILTSGLLTVPDVAGATGTPVSLTVQEAGLNYAWYNLSIGGTQIATGSVYNTAIPASNAFVYVQDMDGYTGLIGKTKPTTGGTYTDNRFDRRMKFEVFRNLTIDSISVYPVALQNVTIRILASDQTTVISTVTYSGLSAGEQRIKIGTQLSPGIYYMDAMGTSDKLSHSYEADTDIHFPYTIAGLLSIMGSNLTWIDAKPYYLFFYKWRVSAGNTCARTPVLLQNSGGVTPVTQTIPLNVGWNLISINVHPSDSLIATLFTGLNVEQIKNMDGFWQKNQSAGLNSLSKITAGEGYLVKMNAVGTLNVIGIPMIERIHEFSLQNGWNMIGCAYQSTTPFSTDFNTTNCQIIKNFDGFWVPEGSTNSISNFVSGEGYFLRK